jgi:hypothetical protein
MADAQPQHIVWQVSSKSNGSNCVEVALDGQAMLVRDSKNRSGAILSFKPSIWKVFIEEIKNGQHSLG